MNLNNIQIEGLVKNLNCWTEDKEKCSVVRFRLGNRRRDRTENLDWFTIKIFGKSADSAADHLKDGNIVRITGQLWQDSYKHNQDGVEVNREEVIIKSNKCEVIGTTGSNDSDEGFVPLNSSEPAVVSAGEDIPFGDS